MWFLSAEDCLKAFPQPCAVQIYGLESRISNGLTAVRAKVLLLVRVDAYVSLKVSFAVPLEGLGAVRALKYRWLRLAD